MEQTVQDLYESIKNPDDTINQAKVLELLKKYLELQNNAKQVYSKVTKGLLNNSSYSATTVISVYENIQKDYVNKDVVCDDILHLLGSDECGKHLVLEYFGKLY